MTALIEALPAGENRSVGAVFTPEERSGVRADLLARARGDPRISAAAITGSGAHSSEDRWSDVDLFFGVVEDLELRGVADGWADVLYRELGAIHHFELESAGAVYRAFLLPTGLEVDLGFSSASDFGALGPHFQLAFGQAREPTPASPPKRDAVIGLAWHHTLHAHSSIERHKLWQAEYWVSGVRDHTLTLACHRLGLPASYAKGVDGLPSDITGALENALVRYLEPAELRRALRVAVGGLLAELDQSDPELAEHLRPPLMESCGDTVG